MIHLNRQEGTKAYDKLNRAQTITWTGAGENFSEAISYNSQTGNIDQITREFGTFTYQHDDTDQLTGMAYTGTTQLPTELVNRTINYDYAGNRATDTVNGTTKSHSNVILENDKFKILPDEDGLGRVWQKISKTENKTDLFDYRTDGQLIRFRRYENGAMTRDVRYYQDALNRRVAKKFNINNQAWTNSYNYLGQNWQILESQNGEGARELFSDGLGIDEHLGKINSGGAFAFVSDHLGTVANELITNDKKAISVFGESFTVEINPNSTTQAVTYAYAGREKDHESGDNSNRNRTHDPILGNFLSFDGAWPNGGNNGYVYGANKSTLLTDPFGLAPGDIFKSKDEAAADAMNYTNPKSIAENREYGSWIYGTPQTGYTYTEPVQGSPAGISMSQMPIMPPTTVSDFHTHGATDIRYANERFSGADVLSNIQMNTSGYLGTPANNFLRYDPSGGFSAPRMCK